MYYLKKLTDIFLLLVAMLWGAISFAAPQISEVVVEGTTTSGQGLYKISGTGFGTKSQAAPILYDFGNFAYENGVRNDHYSALDNVTSISRVDTDPDTLWEKPASTNVTLQAASARSSLTSPRGYHLGASHAFLGWPMAYGGLTTPTGNDTLYVSWWYKNKLDQLKYYELGYTQLSGAFYPGEKLSVQGYGTIQASFNGIKSDAVSFQVDSFGGASLDKSLWNGLVITGQQSGASATLDSGALYINRGGSSKLIRVWEEGSGTTGLRLSWTNMHMTVSKTDGGSLVSWAKAAIPSEEWVHLEILVDLNANRVVRWINSKQFDDFDISSAMRDANLSPTIALIGIDGKQSFNTADISEIYMDSTSQRIVVGDAPNWQDVTHYEIQRPTKWVDSALEFEFYLGSLSDSTDLYVYVVDASGNANSAGYLLPMNLNLPKAPPNLNFSVN